MQNYPHTQKNDAEVGLKSPANYVILGILPNCSASPHVKGRSISPTFKGYCDK